eukprot:jgi/Mesvir1/10049/Mv17779-RA.1
MYMYRCQANPEGRLVDRATPVLSLGVPSADDFILLVSYKSGTKGASIPHDEGTGSRVASGLSHSPWTGDAHGLGSPKAAQGLKDREQASTAALSTELPTSSDACPVEFSRVTCLPATPRVTPNADAARSPPIADAARPPTHVDAACPPSCAVPPQHGTRAGGRTRKGPLPAPALPPVLLKLQRQFRQLNTALGFWQARTAQGAHGMAWDSLWQLLGGMREEGDTAPSGGLPGLSRRSVEEMAEVCPELLVLTDGSRVSCHHGATNCASHPAAPTPGHVGHDQEACGHESAERGADAGGECTGAASARRWCCVTLRDPAQGGAAERGNEGTRDALSAQASDGVTFDGA